MIPQRIAFATSEITPFAKTGGLADVSAALPIHLDRAGHDVRPFVPLYSSIEIDAWDFRPVDFLQDIPVKLGKLAVHFSIFRATMPGSDLQVHFVHCPRLYDRAGLYTEDADEPLRFALLSRAVLESCQRMGWAPDIVHAQDWQTALLPIYLKSVYGWDRLFEKTRTVLTIHNLGYQGVFPADVVDRLGLGESRHLLDKDDLRAGHLGFLKTGLRWADRITTVSPTYAREIRTEAHGFGLHPLLQERGDDLVGILNGVDGDVWNPRTDERIPVRFSAKSLWRKRKAKVALLEDLGLEPGEGVPTIGMITRLAGQKGIDLLLEPLPELLESRDVRLAVLASGESRYETFFSELQHRHPGKVCFYRGYQAELAHRIEAGADMFLMPSLYEPCGLNQMYSLLYGTVPIVRRTGGLADTVIPYDSATGEGNGIVFDHADAAGVRWALKAALDLYDDEKQWKKIRRNGIEGADFSWGRSARRYEELFDELRREAAEAAGESVP